MLNSKKVNYFLISNNIFYLGLNKKIEEKFESLATNIESQLYNNFLKPSINTIEKTMRSNFEDIKNKLNTININSNNNNNALESNRYSADSMMDELHFKSINSRVERYKEKNLDNKLEEINVLGERLYEKLLEKVSH